jgi:hypothetical protein
MQDNNQILLKIIMLALAIGTISISLIISIIIKNI